MDLVRGQVQVFGDLLLLSEGDLQEHLAQVTIDDVLARGVVRSVVDMISPWQVLEQVPQVNFDVGEEIYILTTVERAGSSDSSIDGGIHHNLSPRGGQTSLLDGSDDLPHIEAADLVKLEWRTCQESMLPLVFVAVRVVFEVFFRI